ncbi:MAG: metal-dependent hydrolase [Burkholderiaceae bacterium]|nr:metal-dependent hydrolase [Burkholderiaceae bacterium]
MSELAVRRLLIDLEQPIARHWHSGDAFCTAFYNALSMSFPVGEQFFIDSLRTGIKSLPESEQAKYASTVQGFIGQEATHRRIHDLFNRHLTQQGLVNNWAVRGARNAQRAQTMDIAVQVAITAAIEHFTAIMADWVLRHPHSFAGAEPRLQTMWQWHASEESEHRSTAFNLYLVLGGSHKLRVAVFRWVTFEFLTDLTRQTVNNLWHDGQLFRWRTWRSAWTYLFGKQGMARLCYRPWKHYFAQDFHPDQQDVRPALDWLRDNAAAYTVVGTSAKETATEEVQAVA